VDFASVKDMSGITVRQIYRFLLFGLMTLLLSQGFSKVRSFLDQVYESNKNFIGIFVIIFIFISLGWFILIYFIAFIADDRPEKSLSLVESFVNKENLYASRNPLIKRFVRYCAYLVILLWCGFTLDHFFSDSFFPNISVEIRAALVSMFIYLNFYFQTRSSKVAT
jgi:hypothetical protein